MKVPKDAPSPTASHSAEFMRGVSAPDEPVKLRDAPSMQAPPLLREEPPPARPV